MPLCIKCRISRRLLSDLFLLGMLLVAAAFVSLCFGCGASDACLSCGALFAMDANDCDAADDHQDSRNPTANNDWHWALPGSSLIDMEPSGMSIILSFRFEQTYKRFPSLERTAFKSSFSNLYVNVFLFDCRLKTQKSPYLPFEQWAVKLFPSSLSSMLSASNFFTCIEQATCC